MVDAQWQEALENDPGALTVLKGLVGGRCAGETGVQLVVVVGGCD